MMYCQLCKNARGFFHIAEDEIKYSSDVKENISSAGKHIQYDENSVNTDCSYITHVQKQLT